MWVRCLGVMQVIILALMLIGSSVGAIEEATGQASKEDNKDKTYDHNNVGPNHDTSSSDTIALDNTSSSPNSATSSYKGVLSNNMNRLNDLSRRLRGQKKNDLDSTDTSFDYVDIITEVKDIVKSHVDYIGTIQEQYQEGDQAALVSTLKASIGDVAQGIGFNDQDSSSGNLDTNFRLTAPSDNLDLAALPDLDGALLEQLTDMFQPDRLNKIVDSAHDFLHVLESADPSVLASATKTERRRLLEEEGDSSDSSYTGLDNIFDFDSKSTTEEDLFDFGSEYGGGFNSGIPRNNFANHPRLQDMIRRVKTKMNVGKGRRGRFESNGGFSKFMKKNKHFRSLHEERHRRRLEESEQCDAGCLLSDITCNCERLLDCAKRMSAYDLVLLMAGEYVVTDENSASFGDFVANQLNLFANDDTILSKYGRIQEMALLDTTEANCQAVLEELQIYSPCNSFEGGDSCKSTNARSFQATIDQVCNAVDTPVKVKFEAIGVEFDRFDIIGGPFGDGGVADIGIEEFLSKDMIESVNNYVRCGSGINTDCQVTNHGARKSERYAVRCCADNQVNSFFTNDQCANTWALRIEDAGLKCLVGTYDEAVDYCAAAGARLCTKNELLWKCSKGTGCGFDNHQVWSSDSYHVGTKVQTNAGRVSCSACKLEWLTSTQSLGPGCGEIYWSCMLMLDQKLFLYEYEWKESLALASDTNCGSVSYASCSEFIVQFQTLYDGRDVTKYPDPNPMLLASSSSQEVLNGGNNVFNLVQFPTGLSSDATTTSSSSTLTMLFEYTSVEGFPGEAAASISESYIVKDNKAWVEWATANLGSILEYVSAKDRHSFACCTHEDPSNLPGTWIERSVRISRHVTTVFHVLDKPDCVLRTHQEASAYCASYGGDLCSIEDLQLRYTYSDQANWDRPPVRMFAPLACEGEEIDAEGNFVPFWARDQVSYDYTATFDENAGCLSSQLDFDTSTAAMAMCDVSMNFLLGTTVSLGNLRSTAITVNDLGPDRMPGECCLDTATTSEYLGYNYDPNLDVNGNGLRMVCRNRGPFHLGLSPEACENAGGTWYRSPCITLQQCIDNRPVVGDSVYSPSLEEFALGIVIDDPSDEEQCMNARTELGFEGDYLHDADVCEVFTGYICDSTFDVIDEMSNNSTATFNSVKYEKKEYPEDPALPFVNLPDLNELNEITNDDNTNLRYAKALEITLKIFSDMFKQSKQIAEKVNKNKCNAIPSLSPLSTICWLLQIIFDTLGQILFIATLVGYHTVASVVGHLEVGAVDYAKNVDSNLLTSQLWTYEALSTMNGNMINQHTTMRQNLQDRHEELVNDINEYTTCTTNYLGAFIADALGGSTATAIDCSNVRRRFLSEAGDADAASPLPPPVSWPDGRNPFLQLNNMKMAITELKEDMVELKEDVSLIKEMLSQVIAVSANKQESTAEDGGAVL